MSFALPDGLPPGRFQAHGPACVWVSDAFPENVHRLWRSLLNGREEHGLVPLLSWRDELGSPIGPQEVDAVRLDEVLPADFAEYRRRRLPFWTNPAPDPDPELIEFGIKP